MLQIKDLGAVLLDHWNAGERGVHPPIRWKTIETKGLQNGVPVSV